jgi:cytochrome o ubiquinol oxidase subunit 2
MARRKRVPRALKFTALFVLLAAIVTAAAIYVMNNNVAVLSPRGSIAEDQFRLIVVGALLSLIIIVPVFTLTIYIVWKYRAGKKARYQPEWDHSKALEGTWWLVPSALIAVLAVITWFSAHQLDPYRPLDSDKKPVEVQVVALDWKWLFIYPEHGVASVNEMQVPVGRPINLRITADAPMNSFWVPQLGGQVYAMAGMVTQLHLRADEPGDYNGVSSNISGEGFAGMRFTVRAGSEAEFADWIAAAQQSPQQLNRAAYDELARPSENNAVAYYSHVTDGLYNAIIEQFTVPAATSRQRPHDMGGNSTHD